MKKRIALTGGIACGKSLVARFLNEFGVETIDADDVVHTLIPDPGERRRLAAEVFADPEKRRALESRLHPLVKSEIDRFLASSSPSRVLSDPIRLAIIPLLFETRWDVNYDIICCVSSFRENQIDRMLTTRGYSLEEAEARLSAQMPVEAKAARSHYVINNNGSAEELKHEVQKFVAWLKNSVDGQLTAES